MGLCALELRDLVEATALEILGGGIVKLSIRKRAFRVAKRRDEIVSQGAVKAAADHRIGGGLIGAAAGDQHLGEIDFDNVLLFAGRALGFAQLRCDRTAQAPAGLNGDEVPGARKIACDTWGIRRLYRARDRAR